MTTETHALVDDTSDGLRLDKFLATTCHTLSRSRIQQLIADACVRVSGQTITDCNYRVKSGESCIVAIPDPEPTSMEPYDFPLSIIFEDEHLLVINKQAGLMVHPGAGNGTETMANALIAHCGDSLSGIGGVSRPGIVHRLDKDTSGLIVAAKHDQAHQSLAKQIQNRSLKRHYLALCWGIPKPHQGLVNANIARHPVHRTKMAVVKSGGKEAITHYTLKEILIGGEVSYVECRLETGRTHQIRVHFSHIGHPLLGDPAYGRNRAKKIQNLPIEIQDKINNFQRQALHAAHIEFFHPISKDLLSFDCPPPEDFQTLYLTLKAS